MDCTIRFQGGYEVSGSHGEKLEFKLKLGAQTPKYELGAWTEVGAETHLEQSVTYKWEIPTTPTQQFHHLYVHGGLEFVDEEGTDIAEATWTGSIGDEQKVKMTSGRGCPLDKPGYVWTDSGPVNKWNPGPA